MELYIRIVLFQFFVVTSFLQAVPLDSSNANFKLTILHNNDMHARFEQTGVLSDRCTKNDAENNRCFGGFARVARVVKEFRKKAADGEIPKVLYLNAGDTYTGTPWFSVYKDKIASDFLNLLKPDATSLGNHEFDEGIASLGSFLRQVDFPVLMANWKLDDEPELVTRSLKPSTVLEVEGRQIGIIGYLTGQTKEMTIGRGVEFLDEVTSINAEAEKLKAAGVNIIIALGHSGFEKDKEIAANCSDIDLVIGGHSHTFLYTGSVPDVEVSEGEYPTWITQENGKRVPVVQTYAFTKYLGNLELEFNDEGNLVQLDGKPILLDSSIAEDAEVLRLTDRYRPKVAKIGADVIGTTSVFLDGICRRQECNLGNLITDSMLAFGSSYGNFSNSCSNPLLAIMEGGGIRGSISYDKYSFGQIAMEDVEMVVPFKNKIAIVEMSGKTMREVLEHSVHLYTNGEKRGEFLQVSENLQVTYDMSKPSLGGRVEKVKVSCADTFEDLDDDKTYKVVMTEYLANGGDGYDILKEQAAEKTEALDIYVLLKYFKEKSPVSPMVEGRITIKFNQAVETILITLNEA